MIRNGELRWRANPASEDGFRGGDPGAAWLVRATPHVAIKVKRLFPRASPYNRGWIMLRDTDEVCRDLEWLMGRYPLDMDDQAAARVRDGAEAHRSTERAVHEILDGYRAPVGDGWLAVSPDREERAYQYVAADLAMRTGRLLLVDELGLGKTMTCLLALRDPRLLPALVVCQSHLPGQWGREVAATYPQLAVHVARTLQPYEPRDRREMGGRDPDVLIVPYSKMRGWGDHLRGRVNSVLFDEVQELRSDASQRYRACRDVALHCDLRMGATATPIFNYAGEMHTIMEVLAPGELGTREEFLREWSGHVVPTIGRDHVAVGDPGALGVHLREQGLMLRRTRRDVGRELPEVVRVTHAIDTDDETLDALIEDAADLAEVIVSRAAVGRGREAWVARGEFDWRVRRATGLAKAPYVAEFVKLLLESDEQVLLLGWHRDVYEIWKEKLKPWRPVLYTGSESPAGKERSRAAFLDGDARVMLMSLRSGAGLDGLQQVCHVCVFGELDWAPAMHDQVVGRLHRDGMGEPVVAYFLVSEGGSDPLMAEVLDLKRAQSDPVLDPDAPILRPVDLTGDRIRKLAEQVLERRRRPSGGVS